MGTWSSKYKVTDSNGVSRNETRLDGGKAIDNVGTAGAYAFIGILWVLWKFIKYIFSGKAKEHAGIVKEKAIKAGDVASRVGQTTAVRSLRKLIFRVVIGFTLLFLIIGVFAITEHSYSNDKEDIFNEKIQSINYELIRKKLTKKNFKAIYANNLAESKNAAEEYNSNLMSMYNGEYIINNTDRIDTIEEIRALKAVYGDNYRLNSRDFLNLVHNIGTLDKGYSKELAKFFTEFMSEKNVREIAEVEKIKRDYENSVYQWAMSMSRDRAKEMVAYEWEKEDNRNMEKILKKYNQLSALRAYQNLKKKYKV